MNLPRPALLAPIGLFGLLVLGWMEPSPRPIHGDVAWPSMEHWLGVDGTGRDYLRVLAAGALGFARPGVVVVAALVAAMALRVWLFLLQPVLADRGEDSSSGAGLAAASPPRLLLVMVGMLLLEEPSPMLAAAIVAGLYLPVALSEITGHLRSLREQEVLAGVVAHGLSVRRILTRHLLGGYLAEPVLRHAAALFAQVAFTQIALAYIFGTSSISAGLAVSWGGEFKRLAPHLVPRARGFGCGPVGTCDEAVLAFQAALLLFASLALLGGLLRLARPPAPPEGVS